MAPGSSSDPIDKKVQMNMGGKNVEPFVPRRGHNPKELRSWAKRTGYVSNLSGESGISNVSGSAGFDLERGVISRGGSSPKIEIDPILGRTRDIKGVGVEIEPDSGYGDGVMKKGSDGTVRGESGKIRVEDEYFLGARGNEKKQTSNETSNGSGREVPTVVESKKKDDGKDEGEVGINVFSDDDDDHSHGGWPRSSETKCGLSDNPGLG